MSDVKRGALLAGSLYLLLVLVAPIRLLYIQGQLFADGDGAVQVASILAHPGLIRLGILSDLFSATLEVFLTLALYRLFRRYGRDTAGLMAVLGLIPVPLYLVNVLNDVAVAHLALPSSSSSAFDPAHVAWLVGQASSLHDALIHMLQIFWGAWLLPLAAVARASRLVPRFVPVWLAVNGVAYLALSVTAFVDPSHNAAVSMVAMPAQLGEVAFTISLLWLGIRGADAPRALTAAA